MKTLKKTTNRQKRRMRIRAIVKGTAIRPRLAVFKSLQHHYVQLIDDTKGITIAGVSDFKENDGKRVDRAKALGLKIAALAKEKKITKCVFDRAGFKYHGRIKAIAEGAREGGLQF